MGHTSNHREHQATAEAEGANNDSSDSSCRGGFCHAIMTCPVKVVGMIWYNDDEHDASALNSSSDPIATAAAGFTLPRGEDDTQSSNLQPEANKQVPSSPTPFKGLYRPRKNAVSPYAPKQAKNCKHNEWRDDNVAYDQNGDTINKRFETDKRFEAYQDNPTILLDMGPPVDEDGNVLHDVSI